MDIKLSRCELYHSKVPTSGRMIRKLSRKVRGVGDEDQELTSARGVQDLTPTKSVQPEKVFVKRSSSSRLQDPGIQREP